MAKTMFKPKIGLLPLYIKLYDRIVPEETKKFDVIYNDIADRFRKRGMHVITTPICMLEEDFDRSITLFEEQEADAIVTLHLSYSPSQESIDALASTSLPVIIMATGMAYDFGPGQEPAEIMYNHGLAGTQDLCSMLKRKKRAFYIEAGHPDESDVIDRIYGWAKAAALAGRMRRSRVGVIGGHFKGMADFFVPSAVLRSSIGIESVDFKMPEFLSESSEDWNSLIESEILEDRLLFDTGTVNEEIHRVTAETCLKIRRWLENERLTAFTINFLGITREKGFETVPFLEASKAMARGIGYAGEGDALTASLVGALMQFYPDSMFTEMFCIDWKNDTMFMSHMAELNTNLVHGRAKLIQMNYIYTDVCNPIIAVGRYKSGSGVLVNLTPSSGSGYVLIIAPGEILDIVGEDKMNLSAHGWFRPEMHIPNFIEAFSNSGGTHHSAFVYGNGIVSELVRFGNIMDWEVHIIK